MFNVCSCQRFGHRGADVSMKDKNVQASVYVVDKKHALNGPLCPLKAELWPLTFFVLFFFSGATEAGCWGGADAAAGPRRQPDSHDAGHHGPESVLLQCQADDGEGPGPARALKRCLTTPILEITGRANEKRRRWSEEAEAETLDDVFQDRTFLTSQS